MLKLDQPGSFHAHMTPVNSSKCSFRCDGRNTSLIEQENVEIFKMISLLAIKTYNYPAWTTMNPLTPTTPITNHCCYHCWLSKPMIIHKDLIGSHWPSRPMMIQHEPLWLPSLTTLIPMMSVPFLTVDDDQQHPAAAYRALHLFEDLSLWSQSWLPHGIAGAGSAGIRLG